MNNQTIPIALYFLLALGCYPARNLSVQKKMDVDTLAARANVAHLSGGPDLSEYSLFFQDDFNGRSLDTSIWNYRREGHTVDSTIYLRHNARIKNGNLYLITDRYQNKFSGVNISTEPKPQYHFKYGYFEIRAKLPQGIGNVGAFWFQAPGMSQTHAVANPSVHGAEIDVLEYSASNLDNLFHSLHWNGYDYSKGAQVSTFKNYMPGISHGYHTIALEWTPKEYIVYVDNIEKVRSDKIISRSPEFIILGCGTGGFGGTNRLGPWPDTLTVDYIKAYKRKPEVRLYELCDGYGRVSDGLQPGFYTTAQLTAKGVFNNTTNSCEVPKGWEVTAFDGDNFSGDSIVVTNDTRCFKSLKFNDKVSSLKITIR